MKLFTRDIQNIVNNTRIKQQITYGSSSLSHIRHIVSPEIFDQTFINIRDILDDIHERNFELIYAVSGMKSFYIKNYYEVMRVYET